MPVTYGEARAWATWLRVFTPTDLAEVMGVTPEVVEGFIFGLIWNGTIEDTGERVNGRGAVESVYSFVPLPPGPTEHVTFRPPEVVVGYTEILSPRGMPVRQQRQHGVARSTTGVRGAILRRERAYQAQQLERQRAKQNKKQDKLDAVASRRRAKRQAKKAEREERDTFG